LIAVLEAIRTPSTVVLSGWFTLILFGLSKFLFARATTFNYLNAPSAFHARHNDVNHPLFTVTTAKGLSVCPTKLLDFEPQLQLSFSRI